MKRLALSLLFSFLLFCFHGMSQSDRTLYYRGVKISDPSIGYAWVDSLFKANKVASQTLQHTERKNDKIKKQYSYFYAYDAKGHRTLSQQLSSNNKRDWYYLYEFDSLDRKVKTTSKYGKWVTSSVNEFGPFKEASKITNYKGKDSSHLQLSKKVVNTFDADSNKTTSITYNKDQNIQSVVTYEYDLHRKLGEAKYYNKKGHLKHTWNFDCSKQGVAVTKKNELNICKNTVQLANGHRQEIVIEENKFQIKRNIAEYDENGKYIKTEEYVGKHGTVLNYSNEIQKAGDTIIQILHFYTGNEKNNHLRNTAVYKRVQNKIVVAQYEWYATKNKLSSSTSSTYSYSNNGLPVQEIRKDAILKTTSVINYTYTFRN